MSDIDISQVMQQMRTMAAMAENRIPADMNVETAKVDFSQLLKNSINEVNETQKTAKDLAAAFEAGDKNVNLSEVMVALQKASVSFQAMTQVRNNLVSAYKEIMNMQV
jgi:flagellar hook-basal body complex protein FliE